MKTFTNPQSLALPVGLVTVGIGAVYLIFPRSDPAKRVREFTATVERIDTDIRITSAGQVAPNRKVNVAPKRLDY